MNAFLATAEGPALLIMLPFAVMLLAIAIAPAVWKHGWEKSYRWLAVSLTAITRGYYIFGQHDVQPLRHAALDYLSFIVVVGSFFVAAGSVHIRVRGGAGPASNTLFLFAGAVLANLIGTIGASVLLIRPWISFGCENQRDQHDEHPEDVCCAADSPLGRRRVLFARPTGRPPEIGQIEQVEHEQDKRDAQEPGKRAAPHGPEKRYSFKEAKKERRAGREKCAAQISDEKKNARCKPAKRCRLIDGAKSRCAAPPRPPISRRIRKSAS